MVNSTSTHHEISKLDDEQLAILAKTKFTNHGGGVIEFHDVINVPQDRILPYIDEYAFVPSCGFQIKEREDGTKYILDGEGNEGDYSVLLGLPMRLGGYGMQGPVEPYTPDDIKEFFVECEKALYRCLIRYIDLFPMIVNTLWWKNRGHILKYLPNASLGIHNDNDTNYRVQNNLKHFTQREIAMYQVVNGIIYLNDDFEGGEFYFPYLDLLLKPKPGDVILFPANYMGTHAVTKVTSGNRYTYLSQYGQGKATGYHIVDALDSQDWLPPVYFPFIHQDYERLLKSGHSVYDAEKDRKLGFHGSDIYGQERTTEGPGVGEPMEYDEF